MAAAAAAQLAAASLASGAKNAPPMYVTAVHDYLTVDCQALRFPSITEFACRRGLQ